MQIVHEDQQVIIRSESNSRSALAGFISVELLLAGSCWVAGGYQLLVSLAGGERL